MNHQSVLLFLLSLVSTVTAHAYEIASAAPSTVTGTYAQQFALAEDRVELLNDADKALVAEILAGYTPTFADAASVETICQIDKQEAVQDEMKQVFLNLQYSCMYTSSQEIEELPTLFVENVNANLVQLSLDFENFEVVEALPAVRAADALAQHVGDNIAEALPVTMLQSAVLL
jgi:hypothetical protein